MNRDDMIAIVTRQLGRLRPAIRDMLVSSDTEQRRKGENIVAALVVDQGLVPMIDREFVSIAQVDLADIPAYMAKLHGPDWQSG